MIRRITWKILQILQRRHLKKVLKFIDFTLKVLLRAKLMNFSTFWRWRLCKICKIFRVTRRIITKQVFSVFRMIKAIQKHSRYVPNASKTFFIQRNARRQSFLCVFNPISSKWLSWPSKRGCWRSWGVELKCARKFLKSYATAMFVFAGFLGIISIRRNKQGGRTTPQSIFIAPNVSW